MQSIGNAFSYKLPPKLRNMVPMHIFLLILQFVVTFALRHEKPATYLKWPGKCFKNKYALNDCNWCKCNENHEYTCNARVCTEVDMFGHFNDAIQEINVGMEGRGSWRSSQTAACEPGVYYRREDLLCVCDEDGNWPNPVCRDVFRVLHSVEIFNVKTPGSQRCTPVKLYLVGCNVCFCPSTGQIDPELCTKKTCTEGDPVLKKDFEEAVEDNVNKDNAVYATCLPDQKYVIGCRTCSCLQNNRLQCGNCTKTNNDKNLQSYCDKVKPGQIFSKDCNFCYCDQGYSYCSSKKCLPSKRSQTIKSAFSRDPFKDTAKSITNLIDNDMHMNAENCIPGNHYTKDCNFCYCVVGPPKSFLCTLKHCGRSKHTEHMHIDCVENTVYELNCLICSCYVENGIKRQICEVNPECNELTLKATNDLSSLHGYCEPLHFYKQDCNQCRCLSDGKTLMCTTKLCSVIPKRQAPLRIEVLPSVQTAGPCPKGVSYKIGCNVCFCLNNGDAICTTDDCEAKD